MKNGRVTGRFAPSPTGDLHLGNLRTAAIAWLSARADGRSFLVRMEDLDRHQSNRRHEERQLGDLAAIGVDWDGPVVRQSERFDRYEAAIADLRSRGLVYECYCSRRDIRAEIEAAASAPHGLPGFYPGTCRDLTAAERSKRDRTGRRPALRLRTDGRTVSFTDLVAGEVSGPVDDVVLRRNDGVPAYNLAVVVDDHAQGVTEVVRGDDLLASTPRQILLHELLGITPPTYAHVPLVVDATGERLAKRREMTITLADLAGVGVSATDVAAWIAASLGSIPSPTTLRELLPRFAVTALPRTPCPLPAFGSFPDAGDAMGP